MMKAQKDRYITSFDVREAELSMPAEAGNNALGKPTTMDPPALPSLIVNKARQYWGDWSFDNEPDLQDALAFNMISLSQVMRENGIKGLHGRFEIEHGFCRVSKIIITWNVEGPDMPDNELPAEAVPMMLNVGWDGDVGMESASMRFADAFAEVGSLVLAKDKYKRGAYDVTIAHDRSVAVSYR